MSCEQSAPVCEIFKSMQMEGPNLGVPALFIRFWGCNLRCQFDGDSCDTPYSVNNYLSSYKQNPSDILSMITQDDRHIVFTGGEPLLYQRFISDVVDGCNENTEIEVETNGTIPILPCIKHKITYYSISLKLVSSNQQTKMYDRIRVNDAALKTFPIKKSCFKFVIGSEEDAIEAIGYASRYKDIPAFFMPKGDTRESILRIAPLVIELCKKYGVRYSPREHILIWDTKRGV